MAESQPTIELERVEENILGRGSFGVVYKGRLAGRDVAVKAINRHWNHEYWNKLQNETILLKKSLSHPNVIEIICFEDKYPVMPEIWIAMERCNKNLNDFVDGELLDFSQIVDVIWQCGKGLLYLHENDLVHRDIKPDNFLMKQEDSSIIMKVTDFSLSKDIEGLVESEYTSIHGNTHWLAPELFNDEGRKVKKLKFSGLALRKIDVFSFGLIILFTSLTKQGRQDMCERYELGLDVKRGKDVLGYFYSQWSSDRLKHLVSPLLEKMLSVDAEDRPLMEKVCQFFTSHVSKVPCVELPMVPTEHRLHPPVVSTPPSLVLQNSYYLGYKANPFVGIGGDNLILLGRTNKQILSLLQLQGVDYKQLWKKRSKDYFAKKYVSGDESLITSRLYESLITSRSRLRFDPTRCFNLNLNLLHTHTVGDKQKLIAVLPPHTLVYSENIGDGHQLVLHDGDRRGVILRAPAAIKWSVCLSICQHPESGWLAVTDHSNNSVAVYDMFGELQYNTQVDYNPPPCNALTCTASHLVVREQGTSVLHFHAWSWKEVGKVDLRQVAELGEDEKVVLNVGVCQGDMLHVVVGDFFEPTSLHALRIK